MNLFEPVFTVMLGLSVGLVALSVSVVVCALFLLYVWGFVNTDTESETPLPDKSPVLDFDGERILAMNPAAAQLIRQGRSK